MKKIKNLKSSKIFKTVISIMISVFMLSMVALPVFAEDDGSNGNVAQAIESTWTTAKTQVTMVVDNVAFPVDGSGDTVRLPYLLTDRTTVHLDYRLIYQISVIGQIDPATLRR